MATMQSRVDTETPKEELYNAARLRVRLTKARVSNKSFRRHYSWPEKHANRLKCRPTLVTGRRASPRRKTHENWGAVPSPQYDVPYHVICHLCVRLSYSSLVTGPCESNDTSTRKPTCAQV